MAVTDSISIFAEGTFEEQVCRIAFNLREAYAEAYLSP